MMSLCHGWGWQHPQTATHILITHIQSVWAHWYAVHGHMAVASNSYTHTTWLIVFWWSGSLVESKWCHCIIVEADRDHKLLPTSTLDIYNVFEHIDMPSMVEGSSLKQLYPHYLAHILGFWVTCGVKMISLRHGWGWQPPQTASCIHISHMQSVWMHWYAVHGHIAVASNSYTNTTWLRFWGSGSLVESKWCHYVMVEADSLLKLLPASTLDIYKVFEHIDMLYMGIWQ